KHYRYHRDHGHDTNEYKHLKNQIEDLIRKGYLRKYVDKNAPQEMRESREEAQQQPEEQQSRGVIRTISGEVASGGDHSRDEEVISFSYVDYEGVRLPHDDPVVVTLKVALFTMKRILIDSGSSADILYQHAFDQLRIPTDQLKPVKTPLMGFAGDMPSSRSIDLSVTTGTSPHTQVQMTFLVVDTPNPYNAIVRRPCLNLMEAIVF
ncbi:LOW QUALITY PROTEIN: hypothetical protein CFOL_v3_05823, partial [Cephalotus follicularis]